MEINANINISEENVINFFILDLNLCFIIVITKIVRTKKAFTMDLDKEILKNFNQYVEEFEGIEYEKAAAEVRAKRNELLAQTDKDMAFDRLGINVEDFEIPSLTLTNIVTFVKTLAQAVKSLGGIFKNILNSKMAKYRQDLRDITDQPGFPFNVEWPVLEKDNNDDEE